MTQSQDQIYEYLQKCIFGIMRNALKKFRKYEEKIKGISKLSHRLSSTDIEKLMKDSSKETVESLYKKLPEIKPSLNPLHYLYLVIIDKLLVAFSLNEQVYYYRIPSQTIPDKILESYHNVKKSNYREKLLKTSLLKIAQHKMLDNEYRFSSKLIAPLIDDIYTDVFIRKQPNKKTAVDYIFSKKINDELMYLPAQLESDVNRLIDEKNIPDKEEHYHPVTTLYNANGPDTTTKSIDKAKILYLLNDLKYETIDESYKQYYPIIEYIYFIIYIKTGLIAFIDKNTTYMEANYTGKRIFLILQKRLKNDIGDISFYGADTKMFENFKSAYAAEDIEKTFNIFGVLEQKTDLYNTKQQERVLLLKVLAFSVIRNNLKSLAPEQYLEKFLHYSWKLPFRLEYSWVKMETESLSKNFLRLLPTFFFFPVFLFFMFKIVNFLGFIVILGLNYFLKTKIENTHLSEIFLGSVQKLLISISQLITNYIDNNGISFIEENLLFFSLSIALFIFISVIICYGVIFLSKKIFGVFGQSKNIAFISFYTILLVFLLYLTTSLVDTLYFNHKQIKLAVDSRLTNNTKITKFYQDNLTKADTLRKNINYYDPVFMKNDPYKGMEICPYFSIDTQKDELKYIELKDTLNTPLYDYIYLMDTTHDDLTVKKRKFHNLMIFKKYDPVMEYMNTLCIDEAFMDHFHAQLPKTINIHQLNIDRFNLLSKNEYDSLHDDDEKFISSLYKEQNDNKGNFTLSKYPEDKNLIKFMGLLIKNDFFKSLLKLYTLNKAGTLLTRKSEGRPWTSLSRADIENIRTELLHLKSRKEIITNRKLFSILQLLTTHEPVLVLDKQKIIYTDYYTGITFDKVNDHYHINYEKMLEIYRKTKNNFFKDIPIPSYIPKSFYDKHITKTFKTSNKTLNDYYPKTIKNKRWYYLNTSLTYPDIVEIKNFFIREKYNTHYRLPGLIIKFGILTLLIVSFLLLIIFSFQIGIKEENTHDIAPEEREVLFFKAKLPYLVIVFFLMVIIGIFLFMTKLNFNSIYPGYVIEMLFFTAIISIVSFIVLKQITSLYKRLFYISFFINCAMIVITFSYLFILNHFGSISNYQQGISLTTTAIVIAYLILLIKVNDEIENKS